MKFFNSAIKSYQNDIIEQFKNWEKGKSPYLWQRRVEMVLPHLPRTGCALDAGCGDLTAIDWFAARRPELRFVACDLRPLPSRRGVVNADCQHLPFDDNRFDAVMMMAVIEHVPDQSAAIEEAARVLKPRGVLLVTTPNPLFGLPMAVAGRIGLKYKEGYDNGLSLEKLDSLAVRAGLVTEQCRGFLGLPFANPFTFLEGPLGQHHLARKLLMNQFFKASKGA